MKQKNTINVNFMMSILFINREEKCLYISNFLVLHKYYYSEYILTLNFQGSKDAKQHIFRL
jgi:hypothetical protein